MNPALRRGATLQARRLGPAIHPPLEAGGPDGRRARWSCCDARVGAEDLPYGAWLDRVPDLPKVAHPWIDLLVPGSAADGFIAGVLPALAPLAPGDRFWILMIPLRRSRFTRPLFRTPDEEQILGFDILRTSPTDPALIDRILAFNQELFERNRALGGTHYPIGTAQLSRHDWQRHYRPHWGRLVSAKRRYDQDNVFASGPDILGMGDRPGEE